jgi:ribonuclease P protein component
MSLPRVHRLRRRQEYARVRHRGKRFQSDRLTIWVGRDRAPHPSSAGLTPRQKPALDPTAPHPPPSADPPALGPAALTSVAIAPQPAPAAALAPSVFGISVSKKYDKRAVVRNRARRCVQAAIAQLLPQVQPGWVVIVALRPPAAECKSAHFLRELEGLLTAGRVIAPAGESLGGYGY